MASNEYSIFKGIRTINGKQRVKLADIGQARSIKEARMQAMKQLVTCEHFLDETRRTLSAGEIPVNTSEITSATQLLEAAQRALHDRSLQKLIERDKVQEALNHIDNLLKIIGRLEEILGGKRKTYQSLIEEYNETNRIAIVQKTLQAFKDGDKEIEELERFVNSKPEIRVELQKKTQKK